MPFEAWIDFEIFMKVNYVRKCLVFAFQAACFGVQQKYVSPYGARGEIKHITETHQNLGPPMISLCLMFDMDLFC